MRKGFHILALLFLTLLRIYNFRNFLSSFTYPKLGQLIDNSSHLYSDRQRDFWPTNCLSKV